MHVFPIPICPKHVRPMFAIVSLIVMSLIVMSLIVAYAADGAFADERPLTKPIPIGKRVEPFVDLFLVDRMEGLTHRFHAPVEERRLEQPPSNGYYATVIFHQKKYRHYCREILPGYDGPQHDGHPGEVTAYAESTDGLRWTRPELGRVEVAGSRRNHYVLKESPFCHNFSPFFDARPECPPHERFKALAGVEASGGLFAFVSPDGIDWKKLRDEPVLKRTASEPMFDSQNVAFWSPHENRYVAYCRRFNKGLRAIVRSTSPDFLAWSPFEPVQANLDGEHLYTSQAHPYFRAPHIVIGLATRFLPNAGQSTDIVLLTSRDGLNFDRVLKEAYIRPAATRASWSNRGNYAALNVFPLKNDRPDLPDEWRYSVIDDMGLLVRDRVYRLRLDGFASLRAGYEQGTLLTLPLVFDGNSLVLNYETSAAGHLVVEILDEHGAAIPGFRVADLKERLRGNERGQVVVWKPGANLSALSGRPIRLRFELKEADLYSLQFTHR